MQNVENKYVKKKYVEKQNDENVEILFTINLQGTYGGMESPPYFTITVGTVGISVIHSCASLVR